MKPAAWMSVYGDGSFHEGPYLGEPNARAYYYHARLNQKVQLLYTHPRPAPDALRVAVEALEKIRCRRGIGPVTRSIAVEALQALAALQAEQKGGA